MNKSSLKSKALMNEFNNIIRGATSNEIIIDNNITSERQVCLRFQLFKKVYIKVYKGFNYLCYWNEIESSNTL